MNFKDQPEDIKKFILDFVTEKGYKNSSIEKVDNDFFKNFSHEDSIILLTIEIIKLQREIKQLNQIKNYKRPTHWD